MIGAAVGAYGGFPTSQPKRRGRARKYVNGAERQRAYAARRRRPDVIADVIPPPDVIADVTPVPPDVIPDETPEAPLYPRQRYELHTDPYLRALRVRLIDAAHGNVDGFADLTPISMLIQQGCDLELDVLPVVALEVPELPRPLRNWGAPWLVREILAAREQRLAGHRVAVWGPGMRIPRLTDDGTWLTTYGNPYAVATAGAVAANVAAASADQKAPANWLSCLKASLRSPGDRHPDVHLIDQSAALEAAAPTPVARAPRRSICGGRVVEEAKVGAGNKAGQGGTEDAGK
jgi:hypothetical protein